MRSSSAILPAQPQPAIVPVTKPSRPIRCSKRAAISCPAGSSTTAATADQAGIVLRAAAAARFANVDGDHELFGFLKTEAKAIVALIQPQGDAGHSHEAR